MAILLYVIGHFDIRFLKFILKKIGSHFEKMKTMSDFQTKVKIQGKI